MCVSSFCSCCGLLNGPPIGVDAALLAAGKLDREVRTLLVRDDTLDDRERAANRNEPVPPRSDADRLAHFVCGGSESGSGGHCLHFLDLWLFGDSAFKRRCRLLVHIFDAQITIDLLPEKAMPSLAVDCPCRRFATIVLVDTLLGSVVSVVPNIVVEGVGDFVGTAGRPTPMAVHEVEKMLSHEERNRYINILDSMPDDDDPIQHDFQWCCATAAQRGEALLKTLNKWKP